MRITPTSLYPHTVFSEATACGIAESERPRRGERPSAAATVPSQARGRGEHSGRNRGDRADPHRADGRAVSGAKWPRRKGDRRAENDSDHRPTLCNSVPVRNSKCRKDDSAGEPKPRCSCNESAERCSRKPACCGLLLASSLLSEIGVVDTPSPDLSSKHSPAREAHAADSEWRTGGAVRSGIAQRCEKASPRRNRWPSAPPRVEKLSTSEALVNAPTLPAHSGRLLAAAAAAVGERTQAPRPYRRRVPEHICPTPAHRIPTFLPYLVAACSTSTLPRVPSLSRRPLRGGKYANIVAIYRHNDSADKIGVFDAELINALPASLKFICHNGAGYDQIDVHAAKARGILVSHTPAAVDDATADTAMFLVLSSLRQYYRAEVNARSGKWKSGLNPAHDPENKVLGIIGMGGIGSALAKRAAAFDMKIIYYNRNPNPNADASYTYVKSQQELLAQADVVSLNLPSQQGDRKELRQDPVRPDEGRCHPRQHRSWWRCRRGGPHRRPQLRKALERRSRRLPRRTQDRRAPRQDGQLHPPPAHGHRDRRDAEEDGGPGVRLHQDRPAVRKAVVHRQGAQVESPLTQKISPASLLNLAYVYMVTNRFKLPAAPSLVFLVLAAHLRSGCHSGRSDKHCRRAWFESEPTAGWRPRRSRGSSRRRSSDF
ncbi:hypothetical protein L1887_57204 [Cichorium endivia]|nr:hypothetical protein L1887_57204 [Cichorium endivia]